MRIASRAAIAALAALAAACGRLDEALTDHARPVVEAGGLRLTAGEVARLLSESPFPDSAISPYWAGQVALLWSDYVRLMAVYREADSTRALDYDPLLVEGRYLDALAVQRFRDSVVLRGVEPTEQEQRDYFETRQPFTRLDLRRIRLSIPDEADDAARDSLYARAVAVRERVAGGADFLDVARAESDEPPGARGQVLAFQGHDDLPRAADSILFRMSPGEISPVIPTDDALLIYRIEKVRQPDFEMARDRNYELLLQERTEARSRAVVDTLVENARRMVLEGAVELARRIALDSTLQARGIAPGARLVRYRDGEVTVDELRRLFEVRDDLRKQFAEASDEDIEFFLGELARDEILTRAAVRSGSGASEAEREVMRDALARQLGKIAEQYEISRALATSPLLDLDLESRAFVRRVLADQKPIPWLGEFRSLLDRRFPMRVHERGAEAAARIALDLRAASPESAADSAVGGTEPESESAPKREPAGTAGEEGGVE
ncbi:MAG: peptidylprolyl isomerase [Gemmatimonadota bacterium]